MTPQEKPFLQSVPKNLKPILIREWDGYWHETILLLMVRNVKVHEPSVLLSKFKDGTFDRKKYPLTYKECLTQVRSGIWYWKLWFKIRGVKR